MIRSRGRRRIRPLEQIPVWHGFETIATGAEAERRRCDPSQAQPTGLDALLDGLNARAAASRHARRGAAPRRRGSGHRQDPGHHAPDRVADRDAARKAVGDPRADVHGQGGRGDAAPRRPARPVRLRGHRDLDVPRVRRPADPRVRVRARARAGRPGPVAAGGRRLPAGAAVRPRPRRVPAARRPDAVPRRARDAVRAVPRRGRLARGVPRARGAARRARGGARRRGGDGARLSRRRIAMPPPRPPRRRAGRASSRARTAATRTLLREHGAIDFGDQVALALQLLRESAAARETLQARYRYILVDEFQDTNRAQSELVALLAERHRNVTVVGDDDQSIYRFRGAAISNILEFRDRYRGARTVVLRRNYRSLAPILDGAHRLVSFNDPDRLEVKVGISKRLIAERVGPRRGRPIRHHAFQTAGEEADWIADEIRRRVEAGARPRDHAVLVRANFDADADPSIAQRRGAPVAVLRARRACTRGRRCASCSRCCARSRIPASSVDVYGARRLGAVRDPRRATSPRSRARRGGGTGACSRSSRSWRRSPACCASRTPGRAALARLTADLRRYRDLAQRRPAGEVLYAFLRDTRLARGARRRRRASPPRSSSRTSAGSSTSSGRSRRCSPTTGRSSSPATSRR